MKFVQCPDCFYLNGNREPVCKGCGKPVPTITPEPYFVHGDIEPYLDTEIGDKPTWIKSKKHRLQVCKESGVSIKYGKWF